MPLRDIVMPSVYSTVFASTGRRKITLQPLQANRLAWWRTDYGVHTCGARLFWDKAYQVVADNAALDQTTNRIILSAWVKRTTTGLQTILCKYQDATNYWKLEITAAHKVHFIAVKTTTRIDILGTTSISATGLWYHILVAIDRTVAANCKIYINALADTPAVTPTTWADSITNTGALYIGRDGTATGYLDGELAAIAICKPATECSAAAALGLYNYKQPLYYGDWAPAQIALFNATAHYNCNEPGDTDPIYDQVGVNDGVLTFDNLLSNPGFETRLGTTWKSHIVTDKVYWTVADNVALDFGTGDIFLHARVNVTALGAVQVIAMKLATGGNGWQCYIDETGKLHFSTVVAGAPTGVLLTTGTITAGVNTDISVLVDRDNNTNNKVYFNGILQDFDTNTSDATDIDNANALTICRSSAEDLYYYGGKIAQVDIGKPADAAAVGTIAAALAMYNSGLGKYYGEISAGDITALGITAAWDCTDSGLTTLVDQCGTNDGTAVPVELVSNGGFDSATTGWTGVGATLASVAGGQAGNCLEITNSGDAYGYAKPTVDYTIVVGRSYIFSVYKKNGSHKTTVYLGSTDGDWDYALDETSQAGWFQVTSTFVATSVAAYLRLWNAGALTGNTALADTVTLKSSGVPTVSDADLFANWTEGSSGGATYHAHTITPTIGIHSWRSSDGSGDERQVVMTQDVLTVGRYYTISATARRIGSTIATLYIQGTTSKTCALTVADVVYTQLNSIAVSATATFKIKYATDDVVVDTISAVATTMPPTNGPAAAILSDTVGGYHGVLTNYTVSQELTCWVSNVPVPIGAGYALAFIDAAGTTYVNLPSTITLTGTCSFSFWIKAPSNAVRGYSAIIALNGNADSIYIHATNDCLYIEGLTGTKTFTTTTIADGAWHHVVVTRGVTNIYSVYVDTVKDANAASTNSGNLIVSMFGYSGTAVEYLGSGGTAYLDEIRIYNTELSMVEVGQLFANVDVVAGLVAKWTCDDGIQTSTPKNNETVVQWESKGADRSLFTQITASNRPIYIANAQWVRAGLYFTVDNFLTSLTSLFTGSLGTVFAVVMPTDTGEYSFLSQYVDADSADSNIRFDLHDRYLEYAQNDDGTEDNILGDVLARLNFPIVVVITSSGTAIKMYTDNITNVLTVITGANSGDWFADVTGHDKTQLGAFDGTLPFEGYIFELAVYSDEKTLSEVLQLAAYARSYYNYSYISP